jgi:hypothetical protein
MKKLIVFLFLATWLLSPTLTWSHEKAHSFQTIVGENLVIINYSHDGFPTNLPITFDARLYTLKEGRPVDFANAKITIKKGEAVNFERLFQKQEDEEIEFTHAFREGGDYTFYISFFSHDQIQAEATFPFTVESPQPVNQTWGWPQLVGGGLAIVGLAYLAGYKRVIKFANRKN